MATYPPASGVSPVAGAPSADVARPYVRQPLGLPAGSVRALLTLMVLGIIWTMMLLRLPIPLYLFYLMFLILGHYFAAHGHSIRGPNTGPASPLHLPRGAIRLIIVLGFIGVLGYRYYVDRDFNNILALEQPLLEQAYLPFILVGAFFLGVLVARVLGGVLSRRAAFQDFQAWIALLATIGLVVVVIKNFVINPSVSPEQQLTGPGFQALLAAIMSFYFGLRS